MEKEKAKLLQVGDIIRTKSEINIVLYIDFEDKVFHSISLKDDPLSYNAKVLSQIPLTDEILGKNGFSINVFENCIYYDFQKNAGFDELIKANYHLIKYNSDDYYFFEDCPFIKVRTVDEFQRLLRLMGFVDFANNFKV